MWAAASLGLATRRREDAAPTDVNVVGLDADEVIGELQMRILGDGHTKKSSGGGVYTLQWKGGGCEQWESFGGKMVGIGNTLHSCFDKCAADQKNGPFYRENDGMCGCVMTGCNKRNDHEGYQYLDYYIRRFPDDSAAQEKPDPSTQMRVLDDGHTLDDGHRHKRPEDPTKPAHWKPEQGKAAMVNGKYTPQSDDEYVLEWTKGGCNEWEKLGGRFSGAGHTVKGCSDICAKDKFWSLIKEKTVAKDFFFRGSDGMCGCVAAGCTRRTDTPDYDHYIMKSAQVDTEPSGDSPKTALQPEQPADDSPHHPVGVGSNPGGSAAGQHPTNSGGTNPAGTAAGQHPTKGGGGGPEPTAEELENWLNGTQNATYRANEKDSDHTPMVDVDWLVANGRTMRENRANDKSAQNLPPPWWAYVEIKPDQPAKETALAPWMHAYGMSEHCYNQVEWIKDWNQGTPQMHDVRSAINGDPTQIEREGWAFTTCSPSCCNRWYERSYKGSSCCDTAGPWLYWTVPPKGHIPSCADTGNVAACHPMLGDYPEGMLPQGSNPRGSHPNQRSAAGCLKGALGTFPAPGGTNTRGSAPSPKDSMHGSAPGGNRPWPTFKPPADKAAASPAPGAAPTALNAEGAMIDIPHPKGEVPAYMPYAGGNPDGDPGIPWEGNVPQEPVYCNQLPSPPP